MMENKITKIFVGNVPYYCTKNEFKECFSKYAGFVDADIIYKSNTDMSRGFGFVCFKDNAQIERFINNKDKVILKNRLLRFSRYISTFSENAIKSGRNILFVKNIPKNLDYHSIKKIFSKYGDVGICSIIVDQKTGAHRGSCIVEIIDDTIFENLIQMRTIELNDENKTTIEVNKFKARHKKHNNLHIDSNDIYRIAFNAGKISGMTEMITQQIKSINENN